MNLYNILFIISSRLTIVIISFFIVVYTLIDCYRFVNVVSITIYLLIKNRNRIKQTNRGSPLLLVTQIWSFVLI
jgi:hypothetical protein